MKKKGGIIALVVVAIVVVVVFAIIAYRRPKNVQDTKVITEVEELISKDIEFNYPATPREVVKLYNRYLIALYGENGYSASADSIKKLGAKMRQLYDEELLGINPESTYYSALEADIVSEQNAGKVMLQANVADSNKVKYIEIDEKDCATITASYFTKENNTNFTRTYEAFLLRKDSKGRWKILGFQQYSGKDYE